jgi:hypothetical protein
VGADSAATDASERQVVFCVVGSEADQLSGIIPRCVENARFGSKQLLDVSGSMQNAKHLDASLDGLVEDQVVADDKPSQAGSESFEQLSRERIGREKPALAVDREKRPIGRLRTILGDVGLDFQQVFLSPGGAEKSRHQSCGSAWRRWASASVSRISHG